MHYEFTVSAQLLTEYSKNIIFNTDNTSEWYLYDVEAKEQGLNWSQLSKCRQDQILDLYQQALYEIDIDPGVDPEVYKNCSEWCSDLEVERI